jgi:hypothetical protein
MYSVMLLSGRKESECARKKMCGKERKEKKTTNSVA